MAKEQNKHVFMRSVSEIIDIIFYGKEAVDSANEYLKKKVRFSNEKFCCDYCEHYYPIKDMKLSTEQDTKYNNTVGTFGRPVIESSHEIYLVKLCPRCNRIHNIAGNFHFAITVISIIIAIYVSHKENASYEDYMLPIIIAVLISQGIRFIDWFFISLTTGVRRKPQKH